MNYNLEQLDTPGNTFNNRFTLPLWTYIVSPRVENQPIYTGYLDFTEYPLIEFVAEHAPANGDTLEVFWLLKRILLIGVQIEVNIPAPIVLRPVTNSGILFDNIDCSTNKKIILTAFGGELDRSTDLDIHSIVIDDPDYLGLRIEAGAQHLEELSIQVQLSMSDEFAWDTRTNSAKDRAH